MPHMAPLSSPSPFLYGLHICVNYLHVEDQLKEAITQCGIAKPCVLLTTVDHTDLSETSHMSTERASRWSGSCHIVLLGFSEVWLTKP